MATMLWRMRISLPDRPGRLSEVARRCGEAGVNIVGMQVFPGIDSVTDELVVESPDGWSVKDLSALAERAGAAFVDAHRCEEGVLLDQATRHVEAARTILADPARFPEIVARLLDAEADPIAGRPADTMDLPVGDVVVQVHRTTPFTATEHARGASIAGLVSDVLRRDAHIARPQPGSGSSPEPELVVEGRSVRAVVGTVVVARADLGEHADGGARHLELEVDPAWRRRGLGTRLLKESARLSAALGDDEMSLVTTADNSSVLPMVLGSGLRGRMRVSGAELHVRVPVRDFIPVRT